MRAYELHSASWSRIVTYRAQRPNAITTRLASRRRPDELVPNDGRLVVLACNHQVDPRTGQLVDRRELLDRIVEALSVDEIDGVVATADLLEELTVLNVLEHRLALCATAGANPAVSDSGFDGAVLTHQWDAADSNDQVRSIATDVAAFAAQGLPSFVDLRVRGAQGQAGLDNTWADWIEPVHATASVLSTGAGVWLTLPAVSGLSHVADASGFPLVIRDTDVPIPASAWETFFESELPVTVRGMMPSSSVLFPIEGSVAEAATRIAGAVRQPVAGIQAA